MADAPTGDIKATILAEIAAERDGVTATPPVEDAPADEDQAETETPVEDEVEAAADDGAEEDDSPQDEDEPSDDDEPELKSDDPKVQKGLDRVRIAEKRMREAAARRDADFAEKQKQWQTQVDRVAQIEQLAAKAKHDPVALLRAFGLSDDDLEYAAQAAYAESAAGQKDPSRKAAVQAAMQKRSQESEIEALRREQAETRKLIEQQRAEAQAQAEAQVFLSELHSAASKFPIVDKMLKSHPDIAAADMGNIVDALAVKLKRPAKAAEIVAEYNRRETLRLKTLGADVAKAAPKKPANANAPKPADKKPATSAPTDGAKRMTPEEEKAAILAEIAAAQSA